MNGSPSPPLAVPDSQSSYCSDVAALSGYGFPLFEEPLGLMKATGPTPLEGDTAQLLEAGFGTLLQPSASLALGLFSGQLGALQNKRLV